MVKKSIQVILRARPTSKPDETHIAVPGNKVRPPCSSTGHSAESVRVRTLVQCNCTLFTYGLFLVDPGHQGPKAKRARVSGRMQGIGVAVDGIVRGDHVTY